ncbi:DUF262 domain-containing protein [Paraburkholderia sp. MM5496-R1]|uniref:DUF262 domain-containing protein n=1 Tax=Paraburkholderia sp. MM5496-R1 TaxID=2991065 RepID=UPI003D2062E9
MSSSSFEIPPYQREYSWLDDEVSEFWSDLKNALDDDSYFLGLVILTEEGGRKQVVDGQQRLLTLTLLAAALYHEAYARGRKALAERIQADFLRSIDYDTDETNPRVTLSDQADDETLQKILSSGKVVSGSDQIGEESLSVRMQKAFVHLRQKLQEDLAVDPFKRLGTWTDFITNRLYFAVFVHPDTASAYRVFEVINTRGLELTTADLLKNYILSQTPNKKRDERYREWQSMARQFSPSGANSFVQYIRHAVTVEAGHVLPKDLYAFLAQRSIHASRRAPLPDELVTTLQSYLPLYLQMVDPSLAGPASPEMLKIFSSLNSLGVISVRPILLAIWATDNSIEGMEFILRLVVRRIVVGNLGTGNVERKFGEAARQIYESKTWESAKSELLDLNPLADDFRDQLYRRSFNKAVLSFLRHSIIEEAITPDSRGTLHFIFPRQATEWDGFSEEDASFWGSTIGNTFLSTLDKRPAAADTWAGFQQSMLTNPLDGEWVDDLEKYGVWDSEAVEQMGRALADVARNVWY